MKKILGLVVASVVASSSLMADDNTNRERGWFVGTFGSFKSTKADIKIDNTASGTVNTSPTASSSAIGLMIGHYGSFGRTVVEYDKTSKNKDIENSQISLAFDMIARGSFVEPILGFDVGYNRYSIEHRGSANDFTLGTLGLRAGVAKTFGHHQLEVLYRYSMAFGNKIGNTIYQTNLTDFEDQSLSNYKSNEIRVGYSYRF